MLLRRAGQRREGLELSRLGVNNHRLAPIRIDDLGDDALRNKSEVLVECLHHLVVLGQKRSLQESLGRLDEESRVPLTPIAIRLQPISPRQGNQQTLSADFDSNSAGAATFLQSIGVDHPTFIKSATDQELINAIDPSWSGALPATSIYSRGGKRERFFERSLTYVALEQAVLIVLGNDS